MSHSPVNSVLPWSCVLFHRDVTRSKKVSAVNNWTTPTSVEEVRKFIGLASYYRRYIQGFSDIAKPLHNLTQKQTQFVWSDECDKAFNMLKNKLVQAPILAYPQFNLSICVTN